MRRVDGIDAAIDHRGDGLEAGQRRGAGFERWSACRRFSPRSRLDVAMR